MKILRAIGLAAIAALALIAVSGAGSAAAAETTLCKSAAISPYCASKDRYPKETAIEATKTEFQVDPGFGPTGITVCAESAMKGQTNAQAGEPLSASISTWTFSGCTRNGKACTITAKNLSYAGSLSWSSGDDGALALSNSGKGQPRLFVHCGSWYECEWDMPSLAVEGGNPGQLAIPTTTLVKGTGFNCPATTTLKATYSVSSPKPVFVARGEISNPGTGLCKINQSPCPQAYLYPEGTELEAETSDVKIETNVSTITCSEGSLAAQTTARSDNPLPLEMTAFALDGCNFPGSARAASRSMNSAPGRSPGTANSRNGEARWPGGWCAAAPSTAPSASVAPISKTGARR